MSNRDSTPSAETAADIILAVIVGACVLIVLAVSCDSFHDTGFDRGVRAATKGEAVVVPLPDGTDLVVRIKKEGER